MLKQPQKQSILRPAPETPAPAVLPRRLLYATTARIGASGLGQSSYEALLASHRGGFLGRALTFGNHQSTIPRDQIRSLGSQPVRLLSWIRRDVYNTLKKDTLDRAAARALESGRYDCFHGWSGECVRTLRAARRLGIPALMDIPTWHRDKGKRKPSKSPARPAGSRYFGLATEITRGQVLEEYELADLLLIQSEKARETFLAIGFDPDKLFYVARGVDIELFQPGVPPPLFRLLFVGSLIKRKGVHHLLDVWSKLNLKDAELVLVGNADADIKACLDRHRQPSIKWIGFSREVEKEMARATALVLPSECEGSAKVTYEAAATALPVITTREAGDVVIDGLNGRIIPPNDPDALAAAIGEFHQNPGRTREMGLAGRQRVADEFTWDHCRQKLLSAYAAAMKRTR